MFYTNRLEGESIFDYRLQMADLQRCYNGTGIRLTLHAQLSPTIKNGKNLSVDDWAQMSKMFIDKMEWNNHQVIAFLHEDKKHTHAHYVINRVNDDDLKLYNDSYLGIKAGKVADEIAMSFGLERAKEIGEANKKRKKEVGLNQAQPPFEEPIGSKQTFKALLEKISSQTHKDIFAYFKAIELEGYEVKLHKNKETGELRGYGISKDETYLDASAIDKKFTIKSLDFSTAQKIADEKEIRKVESVQLNKLKKKRFVIRR